MCVCVCVCARACVCVGTNVYAWKLLILLIYRYYMCPYVFMNYDYTAAFAICERKLFHEVFQD